MKNLHGGIISIRSSSLISKLNVVAPVPRKIVKFNSRLILSTVFFIKEHITQAYKILWSLYSDIQ